MGTVNARPLIRCGSLLVAYLLATGMGPCSFFAPTEPETPTEAPIIPHYETPSQALETIARAIEAKGKSNGQRAYLDALAESSAVSVGDGRSYHAYFDPIDLQAHPTWDRFRDWNKGLEPVLYGDLARRFSSPYKMTWEAYEPAGNESGTDSDSLLHRKYRLVQLTSSGTLPVAIGAADLYFVKSASTLNKWVIVTWNDYHTLDADSAQVTMGKRRLDTQ